MKTLYWAKDGGILPNLKCCMSLKVFIFYAFFKTWFKSLLWLYVREILKTVQKIWLLKVRLMTRVPRSQWALSKVQAEIACGFLAPAPFPKQAPLSSAGASPLVIYGEQWGLQAGGPP